MHPLCDVVHKCMRDGPRLVIGLLWLLWALYWAIASLSAKAVREREPLGSRLAFTLPMVIVASLLLFGHRGPTWLVMHLVGGGWTRFWIAVALVAIGVAFAIWARVVLGGNWSGAVTVKEGHELVIRGPYRFIRHPIYTGMLLALLGTGLAAGRLYGVMAFVIALFAIVRKLRLEERFMAREFGDRYGVYRQSSWALLPFTY
jgi:protein-S-isoprenylcysteine O-methyltransferase Ste14